MVLSSRMFFCDNMYLSLALLLIVAYVGRAAAGEQDSPADTGATGTGATGTGATGTGATGDGRSVQDKLKELNGNSGPEAGDCGASGGIVTGFLRKGTYGSDMYTDTTGAPLDTREFESSGVTITALIKTKRSRLDPNKEAKDTYVMELKIKENSNEKLLDMLLLTGSTGGFDTNKAFASIKVKNVDTNEVKVAVEENSFQGYDGKTKCYHKLLTYTNWDNEDGPDIKTDNENLDTFNSYEEFKSSQTSSQTQSSP